MARASTSLKNPHAATLRKVAAYAKKYKLTPAKALDQAGFKRGTKTARRGKKSSTKRWKSFIRSKAAKQPVTAKQVTRVRDSYKSRFGPMRRKVANVRRLRDIKPWGKKKRKASKKRKSTAKLSKWQRFIKKHAGSGKSMKQLAELYKKGAAPKKKSKKRKMIGPRHYSQAQLRAGFGGKAAKQRALGKGPRTAWSLPKGQSFGPRFFTPAQRKAGFAGKAAMNNGLALQNGLALENGLALRNSFVPSVGAVTGWVQGYALPLAIGGALGGGAHAILSSQGITTQICDQVAKVPVVGEAIAEHAPYTTQGVIAAAVLGVLAPVASKAGVPFITRLLAAAGGSAVVFGAGLDAFNWYTERQLAQAELAGLALENVSALGGIALENYGDGMAYELASLQQGYGAEYLGAPLFMG